MNARPPRSQAAELWKIARSSRDVPHLPLLRDVAYTPVIVLGEHRSGTTILYKFLTLSGSFNYLTIYHALYYRQLLANHVEGRTEEARRELDELLRSMGLSTRLVDDIEIAADYPEEYCFILQSQKRSFRFQERHFPFFDEMCRKVQLVEDPGRLLLQKNPFDFDNFLALKRALPGVRFIFIHRDPLAVLNSMLRMVRKNWEQGNVINQLHSHAYYRLQHSRLFTGAVRRLLSADSRLQLGQRSMSRRIARRAGYYARHIGELPPEDYLSLRYEDLCERPQEQMERIFSFLGVTPREKVDYSTLIRPRGLALLPELQHNEQALRERFRATRAYHGYDEGL